MNRDDYMLEKIKEKETKDMDDMTKLMYPLDSLSPDEMFKIIESIENEVIERISNKEYIKITVVFGDYIDPIFKKCKFNSWMIRYNELMRIYNSEKQYNFAMRWITKETEKFLNSILIEWNKFHTKFIMTLYDSTFRITHQIK